MRGNRADAQIIRFARKDFGDPVGTYRSPSDLADFDQGFEPMHSAARYAFNRAPSRGECLVNRISAARQRQSIVRDAH